MQKFTSFYSFTPSIYINDNTIILTSDIDTGDGNKLYIHNKGKSGEFYDILYPATYKGIVNKDATIPKVFDSINSKIEVYDNTTNNIITADTISRIRCSNEYQNTDYEDITITGAYKKARKVEQEWNIQIGRDKVINPNNGIFEATNIDADRKFSPRIRSNYMFLDIVYNNTYDRKIIIPYIKTVYRPSAR
jgi:hypothetical protein